MIEDQFSMFSVSMALPAHKSDELIDLLNQQLKQPRHDEWTLRRIIAQAERLLPVVRGRSEETANTHSIIGMANFMLGRIEKGHASFRQAFICSPARVHRRNYAVMLRRHGFMADAYTQYVDLARMYPDDPPLLKGALEIAASCLQFETVAAMLEALEKLNVDLTEHPVPQTLTGAPFERLRERLRTRVSDERLLVQFLDVSGAVVREKFGYTPGFTMSITDDGEALLCFNVAAEPEEAAEGCFAIAESLISRFDDPLMDVFTISCVASAGASDAG